MAIKIALAGNPNCGKTTLFNALTGSNQFVGNWPGVTVEKKEGKLKKAYSGKESDVVIMDLPGIYSLSFSMVREAITPGTPHPLPISIGMKDFPERPNLRKIRSIMKATRAI